VAHPNEQQHGAGDIDHVEREVRTEALAVRTDGFQKMQGRKRSKGDDEEPTHALDSKSADQAQAIGRHH
jgi:hypothetical protein